MATLRDIAQQLEISVPVVSRVLNGKSDVRASEATRQRIFEVAAQLNYRPTASAKALATGRSMQIAVLADAHGHYPNATDHYPDLRGLTEAAERFDYRVLVLPLHPGEAGERQLENLIVDRVCDGLCVVSYQLELPHLKVLQRRGVPCVIAGGSVSTNLESRAASGAVHVDVDNRRFAADSVAWLHALGHRRIAFAVNEGDNPSRPHLHLLREGYDNAMKKARLAPQILMPMSTAEIGKFAKNGQATAVIVRDLPGVVRWLLALGEAGVAVPQELTLLALMEYQDYAVLRKIGETGRLAFHLYQQRDIGEAAGELLVKWARGAVPDQNRVLIPTGPLGWDAEVRAALEKMEGKE